MKQLLDKTAEAIENAKTTFPEFPDVEWANDIKMIIEELETVTNQAMESEEPFWFLREKVFDALIEALNNIISRHISEVDINICGNVLSIVLAGDRVVERIWRRV